jgi:hypothetical protein
VIALLAVELRRFLARRLMRVMALVAVAGILAAGVIVFVNSSKEPVPVDVHVQTNPDGSVDCFGNGVGAGGPLPEGQTPEEFCAERIGGQVDKRFELTSTKEGWLALGAQLIIVAWLLGASFVGAEWHSGTMTTLLTWEPRRTRVFIAKLIACIALVYLGAVVLELLLTAALFPSALFRGTTAGADSAWLAESAGILGRVGLACGLGAALGFGLAAIGRNTAASLGIGFGYLVVVENLIRGFRPQWAPWLLGDNIAAFLDGGAGSVIPGRTTIESGLTVAAYATVAVVAAWASFRRRDVT